MFKALEGRKTKEVRLGKGVIGEKEEVE